jgi:hypothetical protein
MLVQKSLQAALLRTFLRDAGQQRFQPNQPLPLLPTVWASRQMTKHCIGRFFGFGRR